MLLDEGFDVERLPRPGRERDQITGDRVAVHRQSRDAAHRALGLMDRDVVARAAEPASDAEVAPVGRQARVYAQAVVLGADTEDPLADGHEVPRGGATQP